MTSMSVEEVAAQYLSEFGKQDGPIVHKLTDRVANMALSWRTFCYFFGERKERLDVLNEASGPTARLLKNSLWDATLLGVRRMTDPERSGKNGPNLSLEHLVRIAREHKDVELLHAYKEMLAACKSARTYATKHLAHSDLDHAVGVAASPMTLDQTAASIHAMCEFVQQFHAQTRNVHFRMMPITMHNDEQQFLLHLHQGNEAEKQAKAASRQFLEQGDWKAAARTDIPGWIWRDRDAEGIS